MESESELPLVLALRNAIRNCGLSLNAVARASGVAQSQLSRFLNGKTITLNSAARLFEYFRLEAVERTGVSPALPEPEPEPPPPTAPSTARKTKKSAKK